MFDIDGVLADTRDAVRQAYLAAGVEQPDEAWGISWKIWLPALTDKPEEVHRQKQELYEHYLLKCGIIKRLPWADCAAALLNAGHPVFFVTAASQRSAQTVLTALDLDITRLAAAETSPTERTKTLSYIKRTYDDARGWIYVDDREEGRDVANDSGFTFIHAQWTL